MMEYDLMIRHGRVLDGTGNPWFHADIGIVNGRIQAMGRLSAADGRVVLDATHRVVTPGFIDMHSHSDFRYLVNPHAESKIRQGVTTEVIGNCGMSAAPLNAAMKQRVVKTTPFLAEAGMALDWMSMHEYYAVLRRKGVAVNVAPLVGHGTVRACVMGYADRAPTRLELQTMQDWVREAMEAGAFGLSTGLIYTPNSYANTDEITALCRIVAEYGGIYASHIRGEATTLLTAVQEAITVGTAARVPVEISHHKASGQTVWGQVRQTQQLMEDARQAGIDVTCDVYPYTATSFNLSAMLPPWAHEDGFDAVLNRLQDDAVRMRLQSDMTTGLPAWPSPLAQTPWDQVMIASAPTHPAYEGKTVQSLSHDTGVDPYTLVFDLLVTEQLSVSVIRFALHEKDVQTVLQSPFSMIGSDGSALAVTGSLGMGKPHPRNYGTFPRVLHRYVRERAVLTWPEAIRKMTSFPAQKLQVWNRGVIRVGAWADLVVLDPPTIADTATFQHPHQYPHGIDYVIVNGIIVIDQQGHCNRFPGQILKRTALAS